jgi:hypothetical protein
LENGYFFFFSFLLYCDEPFVSLIVDFNWFFDREVFFLDLFFEVIPLGPDAFVELFSFFEDGELEQVKSFAVLDD